MLAGVERFFVEILRAKDDRFFAGFTAAQLTSVAILVVGVMLFTRLRGAGQVPAGEYLSLTPAKSVK